MRRTIAIAVLAMAAAGVAAAWRSGSQLTAPAPRDLGPPPEALHARTLDFDSESGNRVRGWLAPGIPDRGTVVLAHSVRSNRLELVERAAFLRRAGYSVLLFDAQAHGESAGERITFGWLESHDARAAVSAVRAWRPDEKVAYLGVSQGGAAALIGDAPLDVDALVLEAVYPTLRDAVTARIRIRLGPLAPLVAPLLLVQVPLRLGVAAEAVAPIEGIRRVRAPLLLIAGERDRHTPLADSQRLFDAAPQPKQMWIVPGAAHVDFHASMPAEYERRVLEFLAEALAGEAAPADDRSDPHE